MLSTHQLYRINFNISPDTIGVFSKAQTNNAKLFLGSDEIAIHFDAIKQQAGDPLLAYNASAAISPAQQPPRRSYHQPPQRQPVFNSLQMRNPQPHHPPRRGGDDHYRPSPYSQSRQPQRGGDDYNRPAHNPVRRGGGDHYLDRQDRPSYRAPHHDPQRAPYRAEVDRHDRSYQNRSDHCSSERTYRAAPRGGQEDRYPVDNYDRDARRTADRSDYGHYGQNHRNNRYN